MTAARFNELSLEQQGYYTVKRGVYLSSFHDFYCSSDLYQAENFYVEIFYLHGEARCCMARAFTNTQELNRYLENISIAELFSH
jgi:hypothetical protein